MHLSGRKSIHGVRRSRQIQWYSCEQLGPQRKHWENREKDLKLLIDRAKQGTGGAAVSVVAYQGDYVMAREELKVIEATARAKKCKMPGDWQSDSVIRWRATVAAPDLASGLPFLVRNT
jgi:hypothetical protein